MEVTKNEYEKEVRAYEMGIEKERKQIIEDLTVQAKVAVCESRPIYLMLLLRLLRDMDAYSKVESVRRYSIRRQKRSNLVEVY